MVVLELAANRREGLRLPVADTEVEPELESDGETLLATEREACKG